MKAQDIMLAPAPAVPPQTTIAQAVRLILESDAGGLVVVDGAGQYQGVVTQWELVAKHARVHLPTYLGIAGVVFPFGARHTDDDVRRALATTVGDIMSRDAATVSPDDDVDDVATIMVEGGASCVPVVENDRPVGVIGTRHILRLVLVEEGDEAGSA